jgi:excisionase family DNA binding protein
MTEAQLIGSAEACGILGIDRGTLIRWIASGRIHAVQKLPGQTGAYIFDRAEVTRVKTEQDKAVAS